MYLLLISGIVSALLGMLLIITGVLQCRKRISYEDEFISAEAEVKHIQHRTRIQSIKGAPLISREHSPVICFRAEGGTEVIVQLPWTLAISPEYKEYKRALENGTYLTVKYDPQNPAQCHYGSKKSFRVREAVYKFIAAVPLFLISYLLIWGHFTI